MTYRDLVNQLLKATPEQLEQEVVVFVNMRDDVAWDMIKPMGLQESGETYFVDKDNDVYSEEQVNESFSDEEKEIAKFQLHLKQGQFLLVDKPTQEI